MNLEKSILIGVILFYDSGFNDFENSDNTEEIKQSLIKTMTQNCNNYNANYEKRIVKFADDCFSNENITK